MNELIRSLVNSYDMFQYYFLRCLSVMYVPYQKAYSQFKHAQYIMLKVKENRYKAGIAQLTQELSAKTRDYRGTGKRAQ